MEQPRKDIGTRKDLVLYRLQTAKADFHAINAIHASSGKSYKRHKDAIANFNKEYVKNDIFPREIGRKIGEAEEIRHASDYDDFYIASREESERQVAVADEFIQLAEAYCMKQIGM